ncbi:DUF475 domain-containing protein [Candidatus Parcubacteria bacterium]|nr:DUF475 domain-containing protein [Candidatus Parcubacteria bacterium]
MNDTFRPFFFPVTLSILLLVGVFWWGGWTAFLLALLLTVLEVTLSFDNAVVNARVLARMNEKWQQRFLTWGILFAVFFTRFVLPIFIVAISVGMGPWAVAQLAFFDAKHYGELLEGAHYAISSFGGAFLLMVSLKYFFDARKDIHWIHVIEHQLSRFGRIEAIEIGLALSLLAVLAFSLPLHAATILFSGVIGIIIFIAMQGVANSFTLSTGKAVAAGSAALFVYLNILDAAFSLDGVVGAFAITSQLPVIIVGLGIGAYFVRTLTVCLVRQKTLESLVYLEHGAHWAILGLAAAMFANLFYQVPEVITGLVGLVFVGAAYWSSLKERQKAEAVH